MTEERKGMLLVISGPSGAGKGTLLNRLLDVDKSFVFSVSATTRGPRPGEVDGVHYHFMTQEQFDALEKADAFLEHATVHGNRYGTLLSEVNDRMAAGQNVLLDIDTQGALNVMQRMPDCVSVFILPPSMQELRERLENRHTEAPEDVNRRMNNAYREITEMERYSYVIVNDDLETAVKALFAVVAAEKHRTNRYHPMVPEKRDL